MQNNFSNLIVYQIYVKSFFDSDGDGVGDLQGIIDKLDYLETLGVNAVWLTPCYKSPNKDNGYDVSDYKSIAKEYGGMKTWERLLSSLHERGMKLIMDLVANHTSSKHLWFEEAKKSKDSPYHGYYYWFDSPPNSWQSVFGGSAWAYNKATKEYYLHSFSKDQPDLNWQNPAVCIAMREVVEFWVKKGVDGFRCDVLDYIAKDFEKGLMYGGKHLHGYIKELFKGYENLFLVGECQSDERSMCLLCGKDREELTCVFQFDHLKIGRKNKWKQTKASPTVLKRTLCFWQQFTQKHNLYYTLFTDNHDYGWFLSVFGNEKEFRYESATMYATMFYLLKGIPFLYQGQEIGKINSFYKNIGAFKDVETKNYYEKYKEKLSTKELYQRLNFGSRDNPRRPMAWTGEKAESYGFTAGKPWIKVATNAKDVNVEKDRKSEKSVFYFYKELLALRGKSKAIVYGSFQDVTKGRGYFAYERVWEQERILVVCNFEKAKKIPLPVAQKLILKNYGDRIGVERQFRPFEIAVFRLENKY